MKPISLVRRSVSFRPVALSNTLLYVNYTRTSQLMSALPVASFPDQLTLPYSRTIKHASYVSDKNPQRLLSRRGKAIVVLGPESVEQTSKDAQVPDDDVSSNCPYSPMIFSTQYDHGRHLDQDDDRSVSASSSSRLTALPHGSASQAVSTKASIAALGVSRYSPTPNYDLLSSSYPLNPQRGYWDQHVPPRSSSLPLSQRVVECAPTMSRSSTPSALSVGDDRCSERIVFAERSPDEPEYGSAAKIHHRPSPTSWLRGDPFVEPSSSLVTRRSALSPRRPDELPRLQARTSRYRPDDLEPYSLMGAGPGLVMFSLVASQRDSQRSKPSPKAKPSVKAGTSTCADRPFCQGLKKMKRLATRRSISSLELFSSSPSESSSQDSTASTSTLSSSKGRSLESVLDTDEDTVAGDKTKRGRVVVTHRVVGDVWEPQDVQQIIPALRSMKVSGKLSL